MASHPPIGVTTTLRAARYYPPAVALAVAILSLALCLAMHHPVWPRAVLALTAASFLAAAVRPQSAGCLFPITLCVGDAYIWTGQLLVQEYDPILLGALAGFIGNCQSPVASPRCAIKFLRPWTFWIASIVISGVLGWKSLPYAPWTDQLSVYFSQQNVLRIAKGTMWGLAFAWIAYSTSAGILRSGRIPADLTRRFQGCFATGMRCAIVYVGVMLLVERWTFESLWDFTNEYRATGPFFSMHIGDQHVDAFIVLALPFAWYELDRRLNWISIGCTAGFTCLIVYAALATMSRATLAAVLLQVLVLIGHLAWQTMRARKLNRVGFWVLFTSMTIMGGLTMALLVGRGEGITNRFATVQGDLQGRIDHWRRSLSTRTFSQHVFGNGVGTFPTYMARSLNWPVPPLKWIDSDSGGEIEVQPGWPIYLEQLLVTGYSDPVTVCMDVEVLDRQGAATISVARCTKSLLSSFECQSVAHTLSGTDAVQSVEYQLVPPVPANSGSVAQRVRPQTVGISVQGDSAVRISNCSLRAGRWFFTCDDHLVWRAKNAFVHLFFEQGAFGLAALAVLVVGMLRPQSPVASSCGTSDRWIHGISLAGFLAVACFGTLIDTAWITALLLCVLVGYRLTYSWPAAS